MKNLIPCSLLTLFLSANLTEASPLNGDFSQGEISTPQRSRLQFDRLDKGWFSYTNSVTLDNGVAKITKTPRNKSIFAQIFTNKVSGLVQFSFDWIPASDSSVKYFVYAWTEKQLQKPDDAAIYLNQIKATKGPVALSQGITLCSGEARSGHILPPEFHIDSSAYPYIGIAFQSSEVGSTIDNVSLTPSAKTAPSSPIIGLGGITLELRKLH